MIVAGSVSQSLAAALSLELDRPLAVAEYDRFPDGEQTVAIPALAENDASEAVLVASTPTDAAHVELLLLQDAIREAGVEHLTTVLPYMGYARQDAAFEPGQALSARAMARAASASTDRVLTVNPHEEAVCEFFDVPAGAVDAARSLADPLPAGLTDPLFLAPDDGAVGIAETVADAYGGGEVDHFEKTRHSGTEVEIAPSDATVEGRDVVIADDIVATGTTMAEAISALDMPPRVFVTCVHGVLAGNARTKLAKAGVSCVWATDTLERAESVASVAPALAKALD
ncbi:ribose-phosphate diphosphokinase [Natronorarus salvus]|uniref:ribose-phosphate diphosphokinase n=1 Tax=Natronorarus salvus TaxID=3117733 RepID=UPI002F267012